jgi:drug/metabolite transporter (DMT)-like permease
MSGEGRKLATAHRRRNGVALSAGAAMAFGTGPVMIKGALAGGVAVWTLLVHRLLIAAVLLWLVAAAARALTRLTGGERRYIAGALTLGACVYSVQLACFALAVERISASLVVILFHSFPIVVTVVAVLTGRDRLSALRVAALALGLSGVSLVALGGDEVRAEPLGVLFGLGSAVACASVVLGSDVLSDRLPPLGLTALMVTGAAVAFVVTLPLFGFDASIDTSTWLLIIGLAVVPGVLGTTAMLAGVGAIGPSLASILLALEPPIAVALAWIIFGERLNPGQIAGAALILVAAYLARTMVHRHDAELEVRS